MRATEIIRDILDLIDKISPESEPNLADPTNIAPGDDVNRVKQIAGLLSSNSNTQFANEPQEEYADINSVTIHAGGGLNGPKHPHDIRVKDPSAYPNQQEF